MWEVRFPKTSDIADMIWTYIVRTITKREGLKWLSLDLIDGLQTCQIWIICIERSLLSPSSTRKGKEIETILTSSFSVPHYLLEWVWIDRVLSYASCPSKAFHWLVQSILTIRYWFEDDWCPPRGLFPPGWGSWGPSRYSLVSFT